MSRDRGLIPGGSDFEDILATLAMTLGNQGAKNVVASWVGNLQQNAIHEQDAQARMEQARQQQAAAKLAKLLEVRVGAAKSGAYLPDGLDLDSALMQVAQHEAPDVAGRRKGEEELAKQLGVLGNPELAKMKMQRDYEEKAQFWPHEEEVARRRAGEAMARAEVSADRAAGVRLTAKQQKDSEALHRLAVDRAEKGQEAIQRQLSGLDRATIVNALRAKLKRDPTPDELDAERVRLVTVLGERMKAAAASRAVLGTIAPSEYVLSPLFQQSVQGADEQ